MKENEILQEIIVPSTRKYEYVRAFKQARRRDDDISIVNACFRINFENPNEESHSTVISEMYCAYGGMALTSVAAKHLEKAIVGERLDHECNDERIERTEGRLQITR